MATEAMTRVAEFARQKERGEALVHRLRDWEAGDRVIGYDVVSENASHGKTFRPDGRLLDSDEPIAAITEQATGPLYDPESDSEVFVWSATIERVQTEPRGPDPGEPPLKFAELRDVTVERSSVGGDI